MWDWRQSLDFIQGRDCRITELDPLIEEEGNTYVVRVHCGGMTFLLGWNQKEKDFVVKQEGGKE